MARIVLGVDPGCQWAGWAVMSYASTHTPRLLDQGVLTLRPSDPLPIRVMQFYDFFEAKIAQWAVTDVALETPFLGKSAQNFLKLGYLRGALYIAASRSGARIHELAPTQVKQAVTGSGKADKEQVARLIYMLFPRLERNPKYDMTDAIAVSLAPCLGSLAQKKPSQ